MADLYNKLRDLRKRLAESEGLEVFMVFNNATLEALCAARPQNREELLGVKGMGAKKVEKWGGEILRVVKGEQKAVGYVGEEEQPRHEHTAVVADEAEGAGDKQQITVSQYVEYLNIVFQRTADVKIVGEVSGAKMYPSGFYFTLKDTADETALSCYMPTYTYRGAGVPLEDGMQITVEGAPRLVKRNGRFQFTVEHVALVGEGSLKKAYELLKAKFLAEGLFDRKRPLPEFVQSVGVITSRAGAVIHDFRNNLAKRGLKVYLMDVRVEGVSSPDMVSRALTHFSTGKTKVDVVVIMRGGGSLEDLQGFNSEQVVRAVHGSKLPTLVAIGHDKDVPLAQLAADVMVSTPTAAAHVISATWDRLFVRLPEHETDLLYAFSSKLQTVQANTLRAVQRLEAWRGGLAQSCERFELALRAQRDLYAQWISTALTRLSGYAVHLHHRESVAIGLVRGQLDSFEQFLEQTNPERQLRLGYSIVKTARGAVVRSIGDVESGDILITQVADGSIQTTVN